MRQSNEDFMAEVMRRSTAFRKQRKQKLAVAGSTFCLLLAAGLGTVLYMKGRGKMLDSSKNTGMNTADMAVSSAAPAEESYAEAAENNADSYADSYADSSENAGSIRHTDLEPDKEKYIQRIEKIKGAVFREMTDEELFRYYGITELPLTVSSGTDSENGTAQIHYFRMTKDSGGISAHGLYCAGTYSEKTVFDENTWVYTEIETGNVLYVTLSSLKDDPQAQTESKPERYGVIINLPTVNIKVEGTFPEQEKIVGGCAYELREVLS